MGTTFAQPAGGQGVQEPAGTPDSPAATGTVEQGTNQELDVADGRPAAGDADEAFPVHGYLTTSWRGRWAGGENDQDVYAFLTMDAGDPERHPVTFHMTTGFSKDLGGGQQPGSIFFDVTDTYSNGFQPLLYRAYADINVFEPLSILRVGRQLDIETPQPAYYDGVHVRSKDLADDSLFVGGYAGISTHLYESWDSEDRVIGAYLGAYPWENGRVRLDWMSARDVQRTDGEPENYYSVGVWHTLADGLDLDGFLSVFREEGRDLRLRGRWYEPDLDLQLQGTYYRLLSTQTTSALEFDPFTTSLLDYFPYQQVSLSASKGFGSRYRLAAGLDLRRLEDQGDAGQFNRDFDRGYLTFTFAELFDETSAISLTGDWWDGDGKSYGTAGLDLTSQLTEKLNGAVGTYYSLYKVNVTSLEEREDVRTYFARLTYELTADLRCDLNYDFENTSIDDFHVVRVNLRWRF